MLGRAEHPRWRRVGGAAQVEGVSVRTIFGRGIKAGHATLPPPSLSPSTDLETIDFIPAFAPGEGEAVSDYRWGSWGWEGWGAAGGGEVELRPKTAGVERIVTVSKVRAWGGERREAEVPTVAPGL